jgi:cellulose synthase/poly-beta-1,6-N-acetylglucosamine synthase-like glycosyltransferase
MGLCAGATMELMALVAVLLALSGFVVALFGAYLAIVTIAAFFYRRPAAAVASPTTRVAVLVPAHDESSLISGCVQSLLVQSYPRELFEVVVVADNCSDDTAALARHAGARVIERFDADARGKGHALRFGMDRLLGSESAPDAIVVVDADTTADPAFLATMVARYEAGGAPVVQGESMLMEDGSTRTSLRVAAFLLINRVRPTGRMMLGLPCTLCGNGMMFAASLLRERPWEAYTAAEDLEYAVRLREVGIAPRYARGAILLSPAAPDAASSETQQLRWEGGKTHLAKVYVPRLLRTRRASLLDVAFELALPPLGLLVAAILGGLVVTAPLALLGVVGAWVLAPWLVALLGVCFYVLGGLRAAGAPASSYRAMLQAPLLIARKLGKVHRLFGFRADSWVRTARAGEAEQSQ